MSQLQWRNLTGMESGPCENCDQKNCPPVKTVADTALHYCCEDEACHGAIQLESVRRYREELPVAMAMIERLGWLS